MHEYTNIKYYYTLYTHVVVTCYIMLLYDYNIQYDYMTTKRGLGWPDGVEEKPRKKYIITVLNSQI